MNQTMTQEAPLYAARLRSTSVTYMTSTDLSGEFSIYTGATDHIQLKYTLSNIQSSSQQYFIFLYINK